MGKVTTQQTLILFTKAATPDASDRLIVLTPLPCCSALTPLVEHGENTQLQQRSVRVWSTSRATPPPTLDNTRQPTIRAHNSVPRLSPMCGCHKIPPMMKMFPKNTLRLWEIQSLVFLCAASVAAVWIASCNPSDRSCPPQSLGGSCVWLPHDRSCTYEYCV